MTLGRNPLPRQGSASKAKRYMNGAFSAGS